MWNKAYFRQLFDNSPLAIAILDNAGRFVEVNKSFVEYFQYQEDEVKGQYVSQLIAKGLEGEKTYLGMIKTGQYIRKETVRRRKDGSLINVSMLGLPVYVDNKHMAIFAIYEDITERKNADKILQESEERYRKLVEDSPDGIIVNRHGRILYVNTAAVHILGAMEKSELLQKNIYDLILPEQRETALNRSKKIIEDESSSSMAEFKFLRADNSVVEVEIRGTYLIYEGEPAIQSTIRDITERKRDLYKASAFQKHRLETRFPLENTADLEIIYLPVQMISGDFFHFYKVDNSRVVGILGDVTGKGITAALSISGLKVLFFEIVSQIIHPLDILNYLNKEVARHLENDYVAAVCFSFDFVQNALTVASAGINNYSHYKKGIYCVEETIQGSYLGMFADSIFETREINFSSGDRFYFYTDGLEQVMGGSQRSHSWVKKPTIYEQRIYLEKQLKKPKNLLDDATWLAIEIK